MRTAGIGRMMKKVGGMLEGSGRGSRPASRRSARPRAGSGTSAGRTGRTGGTGGPGGTGGLGRVGQMAKRFLR